MHPWAPRNPVQHQPRASHQHQHSLPLNNRGDLAPKQLEREMTSPIIFEVAILFMYHTTRMYNMTSILNPITKHRYLRTTLKYYPFKCILLLYFSSDRLFWEFRAAVWNLLWLLVNRHSSLTTLSALLCNTAIYLSPNTQCKATPFHLPHLCCSSSVVHNSLTPSYNAFGTDCLDSFHNFAQTTACCTLQSWHGLRTVKPSEGNLLNREMEAGATAHL